MILMRAEVRTELEEQCQENRKGVERFRAAALDGKVNGQSSSGRRHPDQEGSLCGCFYFYSIGSSYDHQKEFKEVRSRYPGHGIITPLERYVMNVSPGVKPSKIWEGRHLRRVVKVIDKQLRQLPEAA